MLTIGLTGGIASGKTRISNLFQQLNVPVVDTDLISRELLELNQAGYLTVVEHFGKSILQSDKTINRQKLRTLIFQNSTDKKWLESTLHPLIYQLTCDKIQDNRTAPYVLAVIPLLFEANFEDLVDRILVVDCSIETQLERLISRDKIDQDLATAMIGAQISNCERLANADDIITNNHNTDLLDQVKALDQKYKLLSK